MAVQEQVNIATADGFGLQLSTGLANELALRVTEAANALPKRGLEVCGLLLGEYTSGTFAVTATIPLTCRYAEGPSFRVSEPELLDQLRPHQPLDNVIGFYRSRNDGSLDLDQQDALLLSLFPCRPFAVLVIRQQKNTAGEGRLFVLGGSTGQEGLTSVGNLFFTRQWLAAPRSVPGSRQGPSDLDSRAVSRPVPVLPAEIVPHPENDIVAATDRGRISARTKWSMAAASAILLLPLLWWRVKDLPALSPAAPIGLESGHLPPPVEVVPTRTPIVRTIDPEGSPGQDAKALDSLKRWIRTDENSTLREIAVRDLARRGTDDPETLPLLLQTAQTDISDRVRGATLESIARGWKLNPARLLFFQERARSDKSPSVRQTAARELANAMKMNTVSTALSSDVRATESVVPEAPAQTARPYRATASTVKAVQPVDLPLPPTVELGKSTPAIPRPQAPLPAFPGRLADPPPPTAQVDYTPPELLRNIAGISVPPDFRRLVRNETVIAVRVAVDSNGRVSKVYPSEAKGGVDRILWGFYSETVRKWPFKPARRNNEVMPGDATFHFRVSPSVPQ